MNSYVAHALDLCPLVIMLLRLEFLISIGRTDILENRGLARVHIFRNRLPMMHRDGWTGTKPSTQEQHCWFVGSAATKGRIPRTISPQKPATRRAGSKRLALKETTTMTKSNKPQAVDNWYADSLDLTTKADPLPPPFGRQQLTKNSLTRKNRNFAHCGAIFPA